MPRYDYKCNECKTITEVVQSFTDDALTICDVCNGPINRTYGSVLIAPSSMPTRSEAARVEKETEVMHKDVAAYKRMRKDGVQPKSIKGSAELEQRAGSRWEVETGMNLRGNEKLGRRFDEAQTAIQSGQVAEL
jgi:putative FmdB family regulatory protein